MSRPTAANALAMGAYAAACAAGWGYLFAWLLAIPAPYYVALACALYVGCMASTIYYTLILWADVEYYKWRAVLRESLPEKHDEPHGMVRLSLDVDTTTHIYRLPVNVRQLSALTRGLAVDRSLSGRRWYEGRAAPFSQRGWTSLRAEMVRQGLGERVGNTWVLTEIGAQAFERGEVSPIETIDEP